MANVLIQFDSYKQQQTSQKTTNSSEIYTDLSLQSKYSPVTHHIGKSTVVNKDVLLDVGKDYNTSLHVEGKNENKKFLSLSDIEKKQSSKLIFKILRSVNIKAIQNSIENIFSFFPGERVLYPEFGSKLKLHIYNGITYFNQERIVAEIYSNLEQFDQRVIVDDIAIVTSDEDIDDNTVALRIFYHIDGLPDTHYSYEYSYVSGD